MQIEDCRWTQLPNDFIDHGGILFVGAKATCIYWCIARKTKGWQKEEDALSYSQLIEMTGFSRDTISAAIERLLTHETIEAIREKGKTTRYKLKLMTAPVAGVDQSSSPTSTSPVAGVTKETLKETSKRNNLDNDNGVGKEAKMCLDYFHTSYVGRTGDKPTIAGAKEINLLKILLRNYDVAAVKEVLDAFFAWDRADYTLVRFYNRFDVVRHKLKDKAEGRR